MVNDENLKIAIAEPSMIIRSGVAVALKRIPEYKIIPIEILSFDALYDSLHLHKPNILIINPSQSGITDIQKIKEELKPTNIKCIALICSLSDNAMAKNYDETLSLYDDLDVLQKKLESLLGTPAKDENESEQETLSSREKEIVGCVAKGMTNKEIADALFLSTHTVITHRRNITRKLQIHSPAGLTIYAIVNKLVELQDIKNNLL